MDTATLKAFATRARTDLIKEVDSRLTVVLAENSLARIESASTVRALEHAIARDGREQVIDRVAYTWFNRIVALRFMDANGYNSSGVVSPEAGRETGQPQVLSEAKAGTFDVDIVPARTRDAITALLNGTRSSQDPQGEAYGMLLEAYCRNWHKAMPFMFEREGDYTELLMPTALLADNSIRDRAVKALTQEVCSEVEVIGWLYQFYISEKKEAVFDGFKRNKKAGSAEIPAATQFFTPSWIVRFLIENSLGRIWMLNNPTSRLVDEMDCYIAPVDDDADFLRISRPEELKIIDPAVGSGHMLTYAFDLLYFMYTEKGYDPAEVPLLILRHNLFGIEIDPRAAALAAFALAMKARSKLRTFLSRGVEPNICVIEQIAFSNEELDFLSTDAGDRSAEGAFWNQFEHGDTLGSLVRPDPNLVTRLGQHVQSLDPDGDLFRRETLTSASKVLHQASLLTSRYSVVVANPPYMGRRNMSPVLAQYVESNFPETKGDLFSAFVDRGLGLAGERGSVAFLAPSAWLYIGRHTGVRQLALDQAWIGALLELPTIDFEGAQVAVAATILWRTIRREDSMFIRLVNTPEKMVPERLREIASDRNSAEVYRTSASDFQSLPGSAMAYWLDPEIRNRFPSLPDFGARVHPRVGMQTGNNEKYLRFWWEVSHRRIHAVVGADSEWVGYLKGLGYQPWYGSFLEVLHLPSYLRDLSVNSSSTLMPLEAAELPKCAWSSVSQRFSARLVGDSCLHDIGSHCIYPVEEDALWALAFMNSHYFRGLIAVLNPTVNYQISDVARIPLPELDSTKLASLAAEAVTIASEAWASAEVAREFRKPDTLGLRSELAGAVSESQTQWAARRARLADIEQAIDSTVWEAVGAKDAAAPAGWPVSNAADGYLGPSEPIHSLISYAVGCMFGRYSLERPGLILADQGSTLDDYLAQIPNPSFTPDKDNVIPIVDGDWFDDDIVARFRTFLRVAFGDEHFEENLHYVADSLGVKDIRDYFLKSFYSDHVKRYKKRPIYWLFRSPKGSFSALIYLHRYTSSTASTVLTGYLREFIGKLEANLEHQVLVAAGMGGASTRDIAKADKEADRIRKILVELRDYEHEVLFPLAGQQVVLDLDDGVLVNYQKLGPALKDIGLKKAGGHE